MRKAMARCRRLARDADQMAGGADRADRGADTGVAVGGEGRGGSGIFAPAP